MRGALLCVWLLIPAIVLAYHYGPGQQKLVVDEAGAHLRAARRYVEQKKLPQAISHFDAALTLLGDDQQPAARRARLERSKVQMQVGMLPEAYDDLTLLMEELEGDKDAPTSVVTETRQALASAQYYMTWLMRLEGAGRDEWEPQIEAARQNYRLLAEDATDAGETSLALGHQEDLESAIRLARLDLSELQSLPLPSQCKGCKSGKCKCKGKCKSPKNGGNDGRGASTGPPPDGRGS